MTTTVPDTAPLDLDNLQADDVPTPSEFGVPDPEKSKPPKRKAFDISSLLGTPAGDKANDAPPRTRARKTTPRAKKGQFIQPLTELYTAMGTMLLPFDPVCANAVLSSAESCAESLDNLAYQNESVRRALISLTQTSAVGVVIFAHLPILMAVLMHHVPAAQRMMGNMGQAMANDIAEGMKESEPVANE